MGLCIDLGYEVVSSAVTIQSFSVAGQTQTFRVTAPTGKKPLSGGVDFPFSGVSGQQYSWRDVQASYPDGDDWVFEIVSHSQWSATLYVVCVNV